MDKSPMPIVVPIQQSFAGMGFFATIFAWLTYKRQWKLVDDYVFFCPTCNMILMVPRNFILDFASIPWFLRWIPGFAKTGILLRNSVPHDFIYRHGFLFIHETGEKYNIASQKYGDLIFRNFGIFATGAKTINYLAYYILRVFGRFSYGPREYDASEYTS